MRQLLRRAILWMGVLCVAVPASPALGQQGAQNSGYNEPISIMLVS